MDVKLKQVGLTIGTDPEAFFERGGKIIGSERVIPEGGLTAKGGWTPTVVMDGVQFELNPPAAVGVQGLGRNVANAFKLLRDHLTHVPEVTCSFLGVVEVEKEELQSLSPKSRILGCAPSRNAYGDRPITVNPKTYRKRSAGGHAHLGLNGTRIMRDSDDERQRLVPLLDILVGNFCVLIDRDPGAAERRENYGRAGEYRLPRHGLEYRTLSNFWLRNYALMSFVFGMSEMAVSTLIETLSGNDLEGELVDVVNIDRVIQAINQNDYDLALQNVNDVIPFLQRHLPEGSGGFPLTPATIDRFLRFTEGVKEYGIERYFPTPVLDHWLGVEKQEFQSFLRGVNQ
jgi:hypothetical protein